MKSSLPPVCKTMCATCPFRPGSKYAHLADYLSEAALRESRFCHSTGSNALNQHTGKPEKICRGARDIQLKTMHVAGVIVAPTDEAWADAWNKRRA